MRLIDADNFKNYISSAAIRNGTDAGRKIANLLIEVIDELPTVEAVPVVHGEWIDGCCSNCGAYIPTDSLWDYISERECEFCYSCGARMVKDNE